ncbi:hypothetical protein VE02_10108 [Pseudogymnoascus sp. 03VT05]|nr:hypothetical protein VE02_10108 [Pseudogymnoascus sp. 03VT05]
MSMNQADGPRLCSIVAVHGLNGDNIKSWTSKIGDSCWLNHPNFLPKYIDRGRVLTWGYNANIYTLMGKTTSSDRILQHAQTLIAELHADRDLEDANERPIIFLCHSMGGIVVKRALAYSASRSAANISHLQSIYNCTFAILFFGTPHNGSSKARLLSSLTKIASLALPNAAGQIESGLVNALKEESETLQDITDQFSPLMSRFRIFFFWEQEKMDLKYTKDYIVEESSAAPILDNTERCGIAADHREMIRFDNSTSQGFRTVMAALRRYTREAPQVIGTRLNIAAEMLSASRQNEAMELMKTVQPSVTYHISRHDTSDNGAATQHSTTYPVVSTFRALMPMEPPLHCEGLLLEDSGRRDSFLEDFQCCATLETEVDKKAEDRPSDKDTDGGDSAMKDESEYGLRVGLNRRWNRWNWGRSR